MVWVEQIIMFLFSIIIVKSMKCWEGLTRLRTLTPNPMELWGLNTQTRVWPVAAYCFCTSITTTPCSLSTYPASEDISILWLAVSGLLARGLSLFGIGGGLAARTDGTPRLGRAGACPGGGVEGEWCPDRDGGRGGASSGIPKTSSNNRNHYANWEKKSNKYLLKITANLL